MSVTRMLVLGVVRIFQPTHGYFVRRELASWQVADWAQLNPGSVYNALRVLTKEGLLIEEPAEPGSAAGPEQESPARGSNRTAYRLTLDGDQEFVRLVRLGLWELHPYEPGWLLGSISFWGALSRDEALAALRARGSLLEARISGSQFAVRDRDQALTGSPDHVVELFHLHEAQLAAELAWTGQAIQRITQGEYGFHGEDPERQKPRGHPLKPVPAPLEPLSSRSSQV